MSVNTICLVNVFCVPLHDVLCAVSTFIGGFENLNLECKCIILIADIGMDLAQINLVIHKYDLDLNVVLLLTFDFAVNSSLGTSLSNVCTCAVYLNVITKTKAICKQAANKEEKIILEKWAKKIIELLRHVEFAWCGF